MVIDTLQIKRVTGSWSTHKGKIPAHGEYVLIDCKLNTNDTSKTRKLVLGNGTSNLETLVNSSKQIVPFMNDLDTMNTEHQTKLDKKQNKLDNSSFMAFLKNHAATSGVSADHPVRVGGRVDDGTRNYVKNENGVITSASGSVGTRDKYARADHIHGITSELINNLLGTAKATHLKACCPSVSPGAIGGTVVAPKDGKTLYVDGSIGNGNTFAYSNHTHKLTSTTINSLLGKADATHLTSAIPTSAPPQINNPNSSENGGYKGKGPKFAYSNHTHELTTAKLSTLLNNLTDTQRAVLGNNGANVPTDISGTSNSTGNGKFAYSNHKHKITKTTINSLLDTATATHLKAAASTSKPPQIKAHTGEVGSGTKFAYSNHTHAIARETLLEVLGVATIDGHALRCRQIGCGTISPKSTYGHIGDIYIKYKA